VLHPAPAPEPVLKYQMLPELQDHTPGNAALLYYRAFSPEWSSQIRKPGMSDKVVKAAQTPLKSFPREEMRWLENFHGLREVDRAARRQYCDWEMTERLRSEGINLLLPDMQGLREFGRLLAARARLEMADGHLDKAIYSLQTGFALARHTGDGPTLIQALVGNAIATLMIAQVEELIQQPQAPNLYWALTVLPRPFIDLRKPIQGEAMFLPSSWTALAKLDKKPLSGPELEKLREALTNLLSVAGSLSQEGQDLKSRLGLVALSVAAYPEARQLLLAAGYRPAELDAMPVLQVVVIAWVVEYNRLRDGLFRWFYLPYYEAQDGLSTERGLTREPSRFGRLSLAHLLLPAVSQVHVSMTRLDRRLAALRCIEAIRLYAVAHDGKLPPTLADIREAPVPLDPMLGKSFEYSTSGNRATLHASPPPVKPPRADLSLTYELTMRR
jgi:hypothetical protein